MKEGVEDTDEACFSKAFHNKNTRFELPPKSWTD